MSDRTCPHCERTFKFPCHLKRHLARKTPCATVVRDEDLTPEEREKPFKCKFCMRKFTSVRSMNRHIREQCEIAGSDEGMQKLYVQTLRRQIQELSDKLDQLSPAAAAQPPPPVAAGWAPQALEHLLALRRATDQELALRRATDQELALRRAADHEAALRRAADHEAAYRHAACVNQISANNSIVYTNTNHITINNFGSEGTTHIDRAKVRGVLDSALKITNPTQQAYMVMLEAAMMVYSDPEHPENLTCYIPNKKEDAAMVHVGSQPGAGDARWEIRPCHMVLPPMAVKALDTLFFNQPFDDAERYGDLMINLRDNERAYTEGKEMRAILIRNKDLLRKALGELPHP